MSEKIVFDSKIGQLNEISDFLGQLSELIVAKHEGTQIGQETNFLWEF